VVVIDLILDANIKELLAIQNWKLLVLFG